MQRHQQKQMIDQVSPAAAIRLNLSNPSARNAHEFAQLDKFEAFEAMLFSVFDGPGYYRANWRAYKLQDGRTAADICRGVKRCTTPLPVDLAMLVFCISTPLGERRLALDNHLPWLVGGNSQEPPHEVAQIAKRFGVEISERSVARIPNERSFRRVPGTRRVTRLPAL